MNDESLKTVIDTLKHLTGARYLGLIHCSNDGLKEIVWSGERGSFSKRLVLQALGRDEAIDRPVSHQDLTVSTWSGEWVFAQAIGKDLVLFAWWDSSFEKPDIDLQGIAHIVTLSYMALQTSEGLQSTFEIRKTLKKEKDTEVLTTPLGPVICSSQALRETIDTIEMFAENDLKPILFLGETGTGKTLLASLYHSLSNRKKKIFFHVSARDISPNLFESALFGSVEGAYTGALNRSGWLEAAHGGTLFIDEIGDIGPEVQAVLLRVIEHPTYYRVGDNTPRKADVTFLFATTKEDSLREEFLHRCYKVYVPPLRERPEDILTIFQASAQMTLAPEVQKAILEYPWPGNIRELVSVAKLAHIIAKKSGHAVLRLEDFEESLKISNARSSLT